MNFNLHRPNNYGEPSFRPLKIWKIKFKSIIESNRGRDSQMDGVSSHSTSTNR
nr:MAG TPA: hypothetical protein [Caudoviricetes sp.]